jgi:hypothetical protein
MTQTEAMQLIKRMQCKLRLSHRQRSLDQSSSASVFGMASLKSGEKQAKTKAREAAMAAFAKSWRRE